MIRRGVPPTANEEESSKDGENARRRRKENRLQARTPHPHVQRTVGRPNFGEAFEGEEDYEVIEEPDLYEYPRVPNATYGRDTFKVKAEIHTFNGNVDIEGCLDWLYEVETFFEVMNSRRPKSFFGSIQDERRSWCMVASPSRRPQAKRRTSCAILAANEESFEREIFACRL